LHKNMGIIHVNGIRVRAYHGCLPEEGEVGGEYTVHVAIHTDLRKSCSTDELSDTVDYVAVQDIVREEMLIRSKLIEHVAARILSRLRTTFPFVKEFVVHVIKHRPPMNADVDRVSVELRG